MPLIIKEKLIHKVVDGGKTMKRIPIKGVEDKDFIVHPDAVGCLVAEKPNFFGLSNDEHKYLSPSFKQRTVVPVSETYTLSKKDNCDDVLICTYSDGKTKIIPNVCHKFSKLPLNKKLSAITMPAEFARIFVFIKDIHIERLQSISYDDAINEGIERLFCDHTEEEYLAWANRIGETRKQSDWGFNNYLWHGYYGSYGTGNWRSDRWYFQGSSYDSDAIGSFSSLWDSLLSRKELELYSWDKNPYVWVVEFEKV